MTIHVRPLPGPGLVARSGDLLLVCADGGSGVEDLLGLVAQVAATGGDGGVLVRRVAALLANDFDGRYPACAASGPAPGGRVAVLVYGDATADVVGGEGDISLSGADAITSVDRLVAGPVRAVRLQLPGAGEANPLSRLDAGIVTAAGVVYNCDVEGGFAPPEPAMAPSARAPQESFGSAPGPQESFGSAPGPQESFGSAPGPQESFGSAPEQPPMLAVTELPPPGAPPSMPPVPPVPVAVEPVAVDEASHPRQPDPAAPFVAMLLAPADGVAEESPAPVEAPDVRPRVLGLLCANGHFTNPNLSSCSACGVTMTQQTAALHEGLRPSLGVLLLDDGGAFRLDVDYVVGREPQHDPEVVAGTVRPLKVADADGVISRRHARVALVGWDVHIVDLGSANGTFVDLPGDSQRHQLVANQPVVVTPGTQVTIGRRWLRYESHGNP